MVDHLDAVQIISCVNGQKVNQSIVKVARDRIEVTNTPLLWFRKCSDHMGKEFGKRFAGTEKADWLHD